MLHASFMEKFGPYVKKTPGYPPMPGT